MPLYCEPARLPARPELICAASVKRNSHLMVIIKNLPYCHYLSTLIPSKNSSICQLFDGKLNMNLLRSATTAASFPLDTESVRHNVRWRFEGCSICENQGHQIGEVECDRDSQSGRDWNSLVSG